MQLSAKHDESKWDKRSYACILRMSRGSHSHSRSRFPPVYLLLELGKPSRLNKYTANTQSFLLRWGLCLVLFFGFLNFLNFLFYYYYFYGYTLVGMLLPLFSFAQCLKNSEGLGCIKHVRVFTLSFNY